MYAARSCFVVATVVWLCGGLAAQGKLTVNPQPLIEGQKATITYENPAWAGKWIVIDIDEGVPGGQADVTMIHLGPDGKGSTEWDVPDWFGWDIAVFTAPDGNSVAVPIVPPPAPGGGTAARSGDGAVILAQAGPPAQRARSSRILAT